MSHDSDIAEHYRAKRESRRTQRSARDAANRYALAASGIPFTDKGTMLMIREPGRPGVDFYPSTDRWRDIRNGRKHNGGADKLIAWYRAQRQAVV